MLQAVRAWDEENAERLGASVNHSSTESSPSDMLSSEQTARLIASSTTEERMWLFFVLLLLMMMLMLMLLFAVVVVCAFGFSVHPTTFIMSLFVCALCLCVFSLLLDCVLCVVFVE